MKSIHTLSIIGLVAFCASPQAMAGINDDPPSVAVSYADLDITRTAGAQKLYQRITGAAKRVCGRGDSRSLDVLRLQQQCMTKAVSDAVRDVDSPLLTAMHGNSKSWTAKR
jgi:UrcA family protein